jgi:hypothetical protein
MLRLLIRVSMGLVLVLLVFLSAYTHETGIDGPCGSGSSFVRSLDSPSISIRQKERVPLIGECQAYAPDGHLLATKSYPEPQYWIYVLIAFLTPFAVAATYRRYRPRVSMPSVLTRLVDRCFPRTPSREPRRDDA